MPYRRIVTTAVYASDWSTIPQWVIGSLTTHITNHGPFLASVLENHARRHNPGFRYYFHWHQLGKRHGVVELHSGTDATDAPRLPIFPPTSCGPEKPHHPNKDWQDPPPPPTASAMPVTIPLVTVTA